MLRLTNYSDANGSYTIEAPPQADWINAVVLNSGNSYTGTDTVPAGAKFVIINATNTLYMSIGSTAAVPTVAITNGTASELVISSTSGWPLCRTIAPVRNILGTIASGSNLLTVSLPGFNTTGTGILTPTDGWTVGDSITVAGAGAAGAALTTTVTAINTSTNVLTLTASASTTVTNALVNQNITTIGLAAASNCIVTLMYYK